MKERNQLRYLMTIFFISAFSICFCNESCANDYLAQERAGLEKAKIQVSYACDKSLWDYKARELRCEEAKLSVLGYECALKTGWASSYVQHCNELFPGRNGSKVDVEMSMRANICSNEIDFNYLKCQCQGDPGHPARHCVLLSGTQDQISSNKESLQKWLQSHGKSSNQLDDSSQNQQQASPPPKEKKGCEEGYSARAFTGECQPTVQVLKFGKSKEEIQQEQARQQLAQQEQARQEAEEKQRITQQLAEEEQQLQALSPIAPSGYTPMPVSQQTFQSLDNDVSNTTQDKPTLGGWLKWGRNQISQAWNSMVDNAKEKGRSMMGKCGSTSDSLESKYDKVNCGVAFGNFIPVMFVGPYVGADQGGNAAIDLVNTALGTAERK